MAYPDTSATLNSLLDDLFDVRQEFRIGAEFAKDNHDKFTSISIANNNTLVSSNIK